MLLGHVRNTMCRWWTKSGQFTNAGWECFLKFVIQQNIPIHNTVQSPEICHKQAFCGDEKGERKRLTRKEEQSHLITQLIHIPHFYIENKMPYTFAALFFYLFYTVLCKYTVYIKAKITANTFRTELHRTKWITRKKSRLIVSKKPKTIFLFFKNILNFFYILSALILHSPYWIMRLQWYKIQCNMKNTNVYRKMVVQQTS